MSCPKFHWDWPKSSDREVDAVPRWASAFEAEDLPANLTSEARVEGLEVMFSYLLDLQNAKDARPNGRVVRAEKLSKSYLSCCFAAGPKLLSDR